MSPVEHELYFKKWCKDNGVERFLFDGDDTVWATIEIFRKFMDECCGYLEANAPVMTRQQWRESMQRVNDVLFEKHGVNPRRWEEVMAGLAVEGGLSGTIRDGATEILMQIYQTPPRFLEGTEEGLDFVRKTGVPFGIVTHANEEWTRNKFGWLGLSRFMEWEDVYVVDENGHKTAREWRQAMDYFGVSPRNCAVVGDSPRSDINPARETGVEHCFLIRNGVTTWSVHNQPVDPRTIEIANISGLIGLGEEHLKI